MQPARCAADNVPEFDLLAAAGAFYKWRSYGLEASSQRMEFFLNLYLFLGSWFLFQRQGLSK